MYAAIGTCVHEAFEKALAAREFSVAFLRSAARPCFERQRAQWWAAKQPEDQAWQQVDATLHVASAWGNEHVRVALCAGGFAEDTSSAYKVDPWSRSWSLSALL